MIDRSGPLEVYGPSNLCEQCPNYYYGGEFIMVFYSIPYKVQGTYWALSYDLVCPSPDRHKQNVLPGFQRFDTLEDAMKFKGTECTVQAFHYWEMRHIDPDNLPQSQGL